MEFRYRAGAQVVRVYVERLGAGYQITVGDQVLPVEVLWARPGELGLTINGRRHVLHFAADGPQRWLAFDQHTFQLAVPQAQPRARRSRAGVHEALEAQMPGVVRALQVAEGETVEVGQTLLLLEAMKMEIKVLAPHAGRVERVLVRAGDNVTRGQPLVELVDKE